MRGGGARGGMGGGIGKKRDEQKKNTTYRLRRKEGRMTWKTYYISWFGQGYWEKRITEK